MKIVNFQYRCTRTESPPVKNNHTGLFRELHGHCYCIAYYTGNSGIHGSRICCVRCPGSCDEKGKSLGGGGMGVTISHIPPFLTAIFTHIPLFLIICCPSFPTSYNFCPSFLISHYFSHIPVTHTPPPPIS